MSNISLRLNEDCAICLESLQETSSDGDRDKMLSEACSHVFHRTCLTMHMETPSDYNSVRKTCPQCRGALSDVAIMHPNSTGGYEKTSQIAARLLPIDDSLINRRSEARIRAREARVRSLTKIVHIIIAMSVTVAVVSMTAFKTFNF